MLLQKLAIVDLESTDITATGDRITEIGIVLAENGEVIEEWQSLVNPECSIPVEIQALTGITDAMVAKAPTFARLAGAVLARLEGCCSSPTTPALTMALSRMRFAARDAGKNQTIFTLRLGNLSI